MRIKKFKQFEGATMKASKEGRDAGEIGLMRDKVENLLKSAKKDFEQVGDDLSVLDTDGETIASIMFRDDYMGIKKSGSKFADEFGYDEFGKFKKALKNLT